MAAAREAEPAAGGRFGLRLRVGAAVVLLTLQVAGIVHARFVDTRYFCWAPYDRITRYALTVGVRGRRLRDFEIRGRYGIPARGTNHRSQAHLMAILRQYEASYGADDGARVLLEYRVNGGAPRQWRWPAP